jgi:hypothetical protein
MWHDCLCLHVFAHYLILCLIMLSFQCIFYIWDEGLGEPYKVRQLDNPYLEKDDAYAAGAADEMREVPMRWCRPKDGTCRHFLRIVSSSQTTQEGANVHGWVAPALAQASAPFAKVI